MLNYSTCDFASMKYLHMHKWHQELVISFSSPSLSRSLATVQFGLHSLHLSTLTLYFQLWPLATSSSLRILGTVGYSLELLCDDAA